MRVRDWCWLTVLACLLAVVCGCAGSSPEQDAGGARAIVLITVDGLLPDELSLFGGEIATPNLEALASGGGAWPDGWTAYPLTRPAVATYLTGLAPDVHGVRDDQFTALPASTPTLAAGLAAAGFATAAFPDSSFLGPRSGLLRGFDVIDDPPREAMSPGHWIPTLRPMESIGGDFVAWVESLPQGRRYFAWVHVSWPHRAQRRGDPELPDAAEDPEPDPEVEAAVAEEETRQPSGPDYATVASEFDGMVGGVIEAVRAHGDLEQAAIVVAGTLSRVFVGGGNPPGAGFSLDDGAIRVPVVARLPAGSGRARAEDAPVWAPDVSATLAALGGVELPGSEGVDLRSAPPAERVLLAWSWVTLDQMGWRAQRAARSGGVTRVEGDTVVVADRSGGEPSPQISARLEQALAARAEPEPHRLTPDVVQPLLAARGLEPRPADGDGRAFGPQRVRSEVAYLAWRAKQTMHRQRYVRSLRLLEVMLERDPQNYFARLHRGQMLSLGSDQEGMELLRGLAEEYPTDPETLHWLAHAEWTAGERGEAEGLLEAIAPLRGDDPDVLYDLACAASLAGDLDRALESLRLALEAGFGHWEHLESDPDLRNLREDPRYAVLLQGYGR